jgi:hypothetical protein
MSSADFRLLFNNTFPDSEFLSQNLGLFAYPGFLDYARTLPNYCDFILSFQEKLNADKGFRKATECVPGFNYEFFFNKTKSGFHDFIHSEADKIKKEKAEAVLRAQKALEEQEAERQKQLAEESCKEKNCRSLALDDHKVLDDLSKEFQNQHDMALQQNDEKQVARCKKRVEALQKTISNNGLKFDYSSKVEHCPVFTSDDVQIFYNRHGTELDMCLYQELCEVRTKASSLQSHCADDFHAQIIIPAIYRFTAQAKTESNAQNAFNLSDFSRALTDTLSGCMNLLGKTASAIGRGVVSGIKTTLSPQHWKDMAVSIVSLASFLVDEMLYQDISDSAFISFDLLESNPLFSKHHKHKLELAQALDNQINSTLNQIKTMSLDKCLEKGVELGTTMILDALVLQALASVAGKARSALVQVAVDVVKSPAAQEYVIEVAGVGKIALEEGPGVAKKAIEVIKSNPDIIKTEAGVVGVVRGVVENNVKQGPEELSNKGFAFFKKGGRGLIGKEFEDFLFQKLGGKGSFKVKSREFDGAIGNVWYEAKSGQYWDMLQSSQSKLNKFKSDMGNRLHIACENGATYELHSNTPIPPNIKNWLVKKNIKFTEWN